MRLDAIRDRLSPRYCHVAEQVVPGVFEGRQRLVGAQAVSKALLTAWLDVYFRGEERSADWLTEDGLGAPDYLTIESDPG